MTDYVKRMVTDFLDPLKGKVRCPCNENLSEVDNTSKKLNKEKASTFHTFVMKALFLCNRA